MGARSGRGNLKQRVGDAPSSVSPAGNAELQGPASSQRQPVLTLQLQPDPQSGAAW